MKAGSPPTPRNARTGELTPPAMTLEASSNSDMRFSSGSVAPDFEAALLQERRQAAVADQVQRADHEQDVVGFLEHVADQPGPAFVAREDQLLGELRIALEIVLEALQQRALVAGAPGRE